jgi:diaminopimelate epimerase
MGRPRLDPAAVPVLLSGPDLVLHRHGLRLRAVGMGNPHAVTVVDDPESFPVSDIGPRIELDPVFPRRTNVEFIAVRGTENGLPVIRQRTWERGSGITQACGTGACAVMVACILDRLISGRQAIVRLDGGDLRTVWPADDAEVVMEGEAVTVFTGDWG